MPTTYTWTGTTSDDFATATNWSPNSSAGGPVSGDSLIFRNATRALLNTLDQSAKSFPLVVFDYTQTGTIAAASSAPFKFDATQVVVKSGAAVYIKGAFTRCTVDMPDPAITVDLDSAGTTTDLFARRGTVRINGGTYTNVYTAAGSGSVTNLYVQVLGGTLTSWFNELSVPLVTAGTVTTYRASAGLLLAIGGTLTNIHLHQAAAVDDRTGANVTLLQVYNASGNYDCSKDGRAKTITTIKGNPAARINTINSAGNITVTNQYDLTGATIASYGIATAA